MKSHNKVKKNLLIESQYLGPIAYWKSLVQYDTIFIEQCEHFVKATYRNRCYIATPNGKLGLSIPILHGRNVRRVMKEVLIANDHNWQKIHWDSLCSAYRRSPYFEYYEDDLHPFYHTEYTHLLDFHQALFDWVVEQLELEINLERTTLFEKTPNEETQDMRSHIHPNPEKEQLPADLNIPTYHQVFEDRIGFLSNLSIVDLLFAEGPNARTYLEG